jgi:hypothetical protein
MVTLPHDTARRAMLRVASRVNTEAINLRLHGAALDAYWEADAEYVWLRAEYLAALEIAEREAGQPVRWAG